MKKERFFQSPITKQVMLEMSVPYMNQLEDGLVLLEPNSVQASREHHMPCIQYHDNLLYVEVGESPHPMAEEHHIQWIYIHAALGGQFRILQMHAPAQAQFYVQNDVVHGVYAYCNLHGLWRLDGGDGLAAASVQKTHPDKGREPQ